MAAIKMTRRMRRPSTSTSGPKRSGRQRMVRVALAQRIEACSWHSIGDANARSDEGTHRYLPKKAWEKLDDSEKEATDEQKLEGSRAGDQYVDNTDKAKKARKEVSQEPEEENGQQSPSKKRKTDRGVKDGGEEEPEEQQAKEGEGDEEEAGEDDDIAVPQAGDEDEGEEEDAAALDNAGDEDFEEDDEDDEEEEQEMAEDDEEYDPDNE